jgi:hypothetical protein
MKQNNPTQMETKTRWLLFSILHVMSSLYAYRSDISKHSTLWLVHQSQLNTTEKLTLGAKEKRTFSWQFQHYIYDEGTFIFRYLFKIDLMNISKINFKVQLLHQHLRHSIHFFQTLSHNAVSYFKLISLVVICTDCISSCKSNYHMITNMTTPHYIYDEGTFIFRYLFKIDLMNISKINFKVQLLHQHLRHSIHFFQG